MSSRKHRFYTNCIAVMFLMPILSCKDSQKAPKAEQLVKQAEAISVLRQPAEYESQEALWLIWNPFDHKEGESNATVLKELVTTISKHQKVVLAVADSSAYKDAIDSLSKPIVEDSNVEVVTIPSVQFWARDMGPSFVQLGNGELAVADFNFNSWGYAPVDDPDNQIEEAFDRRAAKHLNVPLVSSKMISEGGNREVNSKGVLLTVEKVEKGRNPSMTKQAMEAEYSRMLGVRKTIWLKEGLKEDEHTFLGPLETGEDFRAYTVVTTNGHVDEFARFVNDSTILLAAVDSMQLHSGDPIALENHRRLEENFKILREATDTDGKRFNIVRFPMPDPIYTTMGSGDEVYEYIKTLDYSQGTAPFPEGEEITVIAAASYLNFIITNEVIIGQKYCRTGCSSRTGELDRIAENTLQKLFPNKEVQMVDALAVNLGGGGVHCISIHQPKNNE